MFDLDLNFNLCHFMVEIWVALNPYCILCKSQVILQNAAPAQTPTHIKYSHKMGIMIYLISCCDFF